MTKAYNAELCEKKHDYIEKELNAVWKRINNFDRKLWGIMVLLILNLGGVLAVGILLKSLSAMVNGH